MLLAFPEALPVSSRRDDIAAAIARHPVVIVGGETGSGKTTQLPKICLLAGRGQKGLIGHTQPRRLAATSVARRIADELGSPLGEDVGFKIRFNETLAPTARIKLMTDGILLAESQGDPLLRQYDTLIIDEAHERSLNIDFLLGYLKQLISGPRRHDLKLVITSATLDAERFARHFAVDDRPPPMIEVSGRTYPVEIRWRPPQSEEGGAAAREAAAADRRDEDDETDLPGAIEAAIDELWREGPGDVLVFLPGEREIRETADHLRRAWARSPERRGPTASAEILSLFSRLSMSDQQRVFSPSAQPRVVLATNVAETSLTVPGIRYVVDTGLARVKRYRYRGKVEQLQIEPISRAAAAQRSGRCGRVAEGICIRLYDEADFHKRSAFTDPEILRSSLASVILRMKSLGLAEIDTFPFVDPPPRRAITDGFDLLTELDAVSATGQLTEVGKQLARLPVDPRVARMLLAGQSNGCLREVLIIAAALSVQDPRERPPERQQAADQAHARFADPHSDFLGWIKLWDAWQAGRKPGESVRTHAARLEKEFLSVRRLREWSDVHRQLLESCITLGWRVNTEPAQPEAVHRALLTGLLGNLGCRAPEEPHYLGTHATRFWIHPASALSRRRAAPSADGARTGARPQTEAAAGGKWVMAAELVDTTRLYARTVARVDPRWIEQAAAHLLRRSYGEPHWEKRAGQAVALERGVLYGLVVYSGRKVQYAQIDPVLSRELLIRHALVEGDWDSQCEFHLHNRRLIAEIEQLEARIRRPDLLVDDRFLFDWFDAKLPGEITSGQQLERWWRRASKQDPSLLRLSRDELLRKEAGQVDHRQFPRQIVMRGMGFEAAYHFDPGADDDGITLTVPLYALNQVDPICAEWLVPGMLPEKVSALLKSLPPKLRRAFAPVETWARAFVDRVQESAWARPLLEVLIEAIRDQASLRVEPKDFRLETLPAHCFMNFRLLDEQGRYLDASRQLPALRAKWGAQGTGSFQAALQAAGLKAPAASPVHKPSPAALATTAAEPAPVAPAGQRHTQWAFGELPELLEIETPGGDRLIGFPALLDEGEGVRLEVFDDPEEARRRHRIGLRRLFSLVLREPLKSLEKGLPDVARLELLYRPFGTGAELRRDLLAAVVERIAMASPWPTTAAAFEARCAEARPRVGLVGRELVRIVTEILTEHATVQRAITGLKTHPQVLADVSAQLGALLPRSWVIETDAGQLPHLARYLKAIVLRLEKLRADPARDARCMAEMVPLLQNLRRAQASLAGRVDERVEEFRWLLEELRVSLFAQTLRTPMPVSVKRLQKVWEAVR